MRRLITLSVAGQQSAIIPNQRAIIVYVLLRWIAATCFLATVPRVRDGFVVLLINESRGIRPAGRHGDFRIHTPPPPPAPLTVREGSAGGGNSAAAGTTKFPLSRRV